MMKSSLRTKNLLFRNRLIMPPMATAKSSKEGLVTEELLDFYKKCGDQGAYSMIIVEHSFVSEEGRASEGMLSVASDENLEGLSDLARVIQKDGSLGVMQINHAGSASKLDTAISASAVPNPRLGGVPKAMTIEDIDRIVKAYVDAAVRVKKAGFDGVEVHSAHGYLLNQFYSPLTNKRQDAYGGPLENRIKIHCEIIQGIQEAVGQDFPILLRLGACDYQEGGTTIEDSLKAGKIFEDLGVEVLDISGGFCGYMNPNNDQAGYFMEITEAMKKTLKIPVVLTGGITDILDGDRLLKEDKADLIGVGRAFLKDMDWAKKAMKAL